MPPRTLRLLVVAGARPNFMKVAPIFKAAQAHNHARREGEPFLECKLVHTGQHYDQKMSDVFFQELSIPAPDFNLGVGSGSHAVQTAQIMTAFEPVLLTAFSAPSSAVRPPSSVVSGPSSDATSLSASQHVSVSAFDPPSSVLGPPSSDRPSLSAFQNVSVSAFEKKSSGLPDWLIVVGDVNSTMACTLVASKLGIKVAHVEAGLRSFDRTMPEEINRLVTDSLADLLLTPSEDANENLRREGVPDHKIKCVGNIMIDSLVANLPKARASTILQQLDLQPQNFVYVTLHRPSNVDHRESLEVIVRELENLAAKLPVVLPIHPRTRKMLHDFGLSWNGVPGLKVVEPLGYHDSLCLTEQARLVLTDSGGLQEESTYFRTPCLTLRPNTERPVTLTQGSNRLTDLPRLRADISKLLEGERRLGAVPPRWDGRTAERIIAELLCGG